MEEALKDEDRSIAVEERYDNLMNKSRILDAMSRKDDATAARNQALTMASVIQLHHTAASSATRQTGRSI